MRKAVKGAEYMLCEPRLFTILKSIPQSYINTIDIIHNLLLLILNRVIYYVKQYARFHKLKYFIRS
jgi:hypothetical protein